MNFIYEFTCCIEVDGSNRGLLYKKKLDQLNDDM